MIKKHIFNFQSIHKYYEKECLGIKNNTVRYIDLDDNRFTQLIAWMETGWNDGDIKIKITNALCTDTFFVRDIRDICIWGDLMIITWNHKGDK